jgi:integration host factor subunit alpha
MESTLGKGENVLISGFGKFEVRVKNSRRGRNPTTGNDLILDARRIVKFKRSRILREKMNPGKKGTGRK